jgi:hypothetical protein
MSCRAGWREASEHACQRTSPYKSKTQGGQTRMRKNLRQVQIPIVFFIFDHEIVAPRQLQFHH